MRRMRGKRRFWWAADQRSGRSAAACESQKDLKRRLLRSADSGPRESRDMRRGVCRVVCAYGQNVNFRIPRLTAGRKL